MPPRDFHSSFSSPLFLFTLAVSHCVSLCLFLSIWFPCKRDLYDYLLFLTIHCVHTSSRVFAFIFFPTRLRRPSLPPSPFGRITPIPSLPCSPACVVYPHPPFVFLLGGAVRHYLHAAPAPGSHSRGRKGRCGEGGEVRCDRRLADSSGGEPLEGDSLAVL